VLWADTSAKWSKQLEKRERPQFNPHPLAAINWGARKLTGVKLKVGPSSEILGCFAS